MHELSIAVALVQEASEAALAEHARRIRSITVVLGRLSGVEVEPLQAAFPLAAEGTMLDGSELILKHQEAITRCRRCGQDSPVQETGFLCAKCNSTDTELISGREITLSTMELEVDE